MRDPSVLCFIWGIVWYGTRRQSDYSSIGISFASESAISKAFQVLSSVWCENSLNQEIQTTTSETCDLLCDWDSFLFSILSFPDRYSHNTLSSSLIILIMFGKCLFNTCVCCWVARDCMRALFPWISSSLHLSILQCAWGLTGAYGRHWLLLTKPNSFPSWTHSETFPSLLWVGYD